MTLRIGTRGSQLALWQANTVKDLLAKQGHVAELVIIKTTGDRLSEAGTGPQPSSFSKRVFVKEIEDAMLRREVDLAVHSAKDMPAELPEGLGVAAVLAREDPRDALVLPRGHAGHGLNFAAAIGRLDAAPRLGTSSIRRVAQLRAVLPAARYEPVRGNVDTRLRKLDERGYDALILAAAGLRRLGLGDRISALLPIEICTPAPGQGTIAIEFREDDERTRRALQPLNDEDAAMALEAERTLVAALGGGCQLPLGAIATPTADGQLALTAVVISADGATVLRRSATGETTVPYTIGQKVAKMLLDAGAGAILDEVRAADKPAQGAP
ncbi:MAG TPA: hydroxymethylbilane synthase [Vicinamibacterales bacterium]|nr:hydroxymethylbilane synthase [Vicinamibacterales bacterium]